jgi:pimeloyl-ACP methyl ester carboxylesterase
MRREETGSQPGARTPAHRLRTPETAVLIHGNAESSIVWYAWMPRMGQEFRVLRPDLPGFGRSRIPSGFE